MKMFIGQYNNNMDVKKRLTFPAKLRSQIEEGLIITRGLDGCVIAYTKERWEQITAKLATLPTTKKQARDYARLVLASAAEVEFDKNGRINIPAHLCNWAKLEKSCVIVGTGMQIEIWDENKWQEYNASIEDHFEEIAQDLVDFEL